MFLALLETSANQQFIFSTNKLRENIGASELTYMAGTQWVVKAVCEVNGQNCDSEIFDRSDGLRKWLLNSEKNLSIDNDDDSKKIEILIATSGKALFLAKKKEDAQKVIEKVTLRALKEAPGLDICGIISNPFDLTDKKLNDVNAAIHKNFDTVHGRKSGPVNRFLRLPVVDQCASSGLPANKSIQDADGKSITSLVSEAKRNHRDRGFKRIQTLLTEENERWKLIEKDSDFEEESSWKAIVHADGNGLGQIFLDFGKSIQTNPESKDEKEYNRLYIQKYRQFSLAIDICTEKAFLEAIRTVFADRLEEDDSQESRKLPLRPLVLGGDDLTVICAGEYALKFTKQFLESFEQLTSREVEGFEAPRIIIEEAQKHLPAPRLSACAGVAIVKNHFPFSVAYGLAEELIKSAKTVKKIVQDKDKKTIPCSAIDFHVLYDSSGVDLKLIREKLDIAHLPINNITKTRLYCRPYVVSTADRFAGNSCKEWIERHHWKKLEQRVNALKSRDGDGELNLPNSQMHDLREGLFFGKGGADARYGLIRSRYASVGIENLEGDVLESLFWEETVKNSEDKDNQSFMTGFLDAMDAASFWAGDRNNE